MNASVTYDENGSITNFTVNARQETGLKGHFRMEGSSAIFTSVLQSDYAPDNNVYMNNVKTIMDYAESLSFVQAVALEEMHE